MEIALLFHFCLAHTHTHISRNGKVFARPREHFIWRNFNTRLLVLSTVKSHWKIVIAVQLEYVWKIRHQTVVCIPGQFVHTHTHTSNCNPRRLGRFQCGCKFSIVPIYIFEMGRKRLRKCNYLTLLKSM